VAARDRYESLETALAVIAYRWEVHGEQITEADELAAIEALHAEAASFPARHVPLAELYPRVARLAALSMGVLAALGDPDEVDGLQGFEGFELWRQSRHR
jgi:hypothetical protein